MAKRKGFTLAEVVAKYFRVKAAIDRGYKRADKLEEQIFKEMAPGDSVPLNEFERAVMVDNFWKDGKPINKAYRAHGISRFELKKVKA